MLKKLNGMLVNKSDNVVLFSTDSKLTDNEEFKPYTADNDKRKFEMVELLNNFYYIGRVGEHFVRHTPTRKHSIRMYVIFDEDGKPIAVSWNPSIKIKDIWYVSWGYYTPTFLCLNDAPERERCFSIVGYCEHQILNLEANTKFQAELWVKGLRKLIQLQQTDKTANELSEQNLQSLLMQTETQNQQLQQNEQQITEIQETLFENEMRIACQEMNVDYGLHQKLAAALLYNAILSKRVSFEKWQWFVKTNIDYVKISDSIIRLIPSNCRAHYVREHNDVLRVDPYFESCDISLNHSTFKMIKASLIDDIKNETYALVIFESVSNSNYFITNCASQLKMIKINFNNNIKDYVFKIVPALSGRNQYVSFQSVNNPNQYIRNKHFHLLLKTQSNDKLYALESSFYIEQTTTTPECIDTSTCTVSKVNNPDDKNNVLNIYWSTPRLLFGQVVYKIIYDDQKEELVTSLPYSIPLKSTPVSFKVVTINEDNNEQSAASEIIRVDYQDRQKMVRELEQLCSVESISELQNYNNDELLEKLHVAKFLLGIGSRTSDQLMKMPIDAHRNALITEAMFRSNTYSTEMLRSQNDQHIIDIIKSFHNLKSIDFQSRSTSYVLDDNMDKEVLLLSEAKHGSSIDIDFNLYKRHYDKCDEKDDDPYQACNAFKRLIYGLQYYMSLDVKNKPDDKDAFAA
eukprot:234973_1